MNYIWAGLMGLCVFYAILSGNIGALSEGVLSGAGNAVDIALRLLGAMILWNGIEEIISRSGLQKKAERLLSPFMKLIFPKYHNTDAGAFMCANITANLLGLGNGATPLGIEAMRRIKAINDSTSADNETVRFVIINSTCMTLIPATAAALRNAAGSKEPFSIIIPVWITGTLAILGGLIMEKILSKRWK